MTIAKNQKRLNRCLADLGKWVNGNQFHNVLFYKTTVGTWVEANSENTFVGGFSHYGESYDTAQTASDDPMTLRIQ